jgi:hypothetical protein
MLEAAGKSSVRWPSHIHALTRPLRWLGEKPLLLDRAEWYGS